MSRSCKNVHPATLCQLSLLISFLTLLLAADAHALTAREIVDENAKRYRMESFRSGVHITKMQGTKVISSHFLWIMGMSDDDMTSLFVEFEEPEEARGMRFLIRYPTTGGSSTVKAFVFIPTTGAEVPLKSGGARDVGGTGMTVEDFRGFVPSTDGELKLAGEETINGRECYVIAVSSPSGELANRIWISKQHFLVVKTETLSPEGTTEREFRVTEFFVAQDGKMWPRKEEILIPKEGVRIIVDQQGGLYNVALPEELFDPATFGKFQWRISTE